MLKYLPNALTTLRLLLALPLGFLILEEDYFGALLVGVLAGITDVLDGFAARRLHAFSRLGTILDPVADKLLVTVTFVSLATVGLVSWSVTAVVIGRDLVIVCGALAYHQLIGEFEFAATPLSKLNMAVQIAFCVLLLGAELIVHIPPGLIAAANVVVMVAAVASGLDYVVTWSLKAYRSRAKEDGQNGG